MIIDVSLKDSITGREFFNSYCDNVNGYSKYRGRKITCESYDLPTTEYNARRLFMWKATEYKKTSLLVSAVVNIKNNRRYKRRGIEVIRKIEVLRFHLAVNPPPSACLTFSRLNGECINAAIPQ